MKPFKCQCSRSGHGHQSQRCEHLSVGEFENDDFTLWLCNLCLPFYDNMNELKAEQSAKERT